MGNVNETAKRDLPTLRHWADRLLRLANKMVEDIRYSEEDHLGFMALCFLSKQIDHLNSIVTLIPSRDAVLVARSMIEGLFQLLWAAKDPASRPLQWRAFAWIHDWRMMQAKIAQGESVDPERRAAIEDTLRKYGDLFLTKKAREARKQDAPLPPDPYHHNWRCGRQILQICEEVEGEDLYKRIYGPFSDWHHWGAGGLGEAISRRENQVVYSSLSPADSATALACGFQCLLQTAEITNKHLGFGLESKISELRSRYVDWHKVH